MDAVDIVDDMDEMDKIRRRYEARSPRKSIPPP
jgi:hypothetical protein